MQSESKYTVDVAAMPSACLATIDAATNDEYTRLRKEVMLIVAMVVDDDGNEMLDWRSVDGESPETSGSLAYSCCQKRYREVAEMLRTRSALGGLVISAGAWKVRMKHVRRLEVDEKDCYSYILMLTM